MNRNEWLEEAVV